MTWLKLGDEFTRDTARAGLSDAAFRTHVEALAFALDRENDGRMRRRDVLRFAETEDPGAAVDELMDAGLWEMDGPDGLRVVHHMEHQPSSANLSDKRANDARRQQRKRERDALVASGLDDAAVEAELERRGLARPARGKASRGPSRSESHRDVTRDKESDVTRDPGRVGTGRNGPGLNRSFYVDEDESPACGCGICGGRGKPTGCEWCGVIA
ncbi:hypothetical protein F7P69_00860 [Cellulosimicrobium funkei]|nr:hypothetical protein [Cellulosimicrobium funkei]